MYANIADSIFFKIPKVKLLYITQVASDVRSNEIEPYTRRSGKCPTYQAPEGR